jgi:hypothetical protein
MLFENSGLAGPIPNRPRNMGYGQTWIIAKTQIKQCRAWPLPAQASLTLAGYCQILNLSRPAGPPEPSGLWDLLGCSLGPKHDFGPGPDQQDLPQRPCGE